MVLLIAQRRREKGREWAPPSTQPWLCVHCLFSLYSDFIFHFSIFFITTTKNDANLSLLQLAGAVLPRPLLANNAPIICIVDMLRGGVADSHVIRPLIRIRVDSSTAEAKSAYFFFVALLLAKMIDGQADALL